MLKSLNGHYWADFFQRAFSNNFKIDRRDVEAILSLHDNQIYVPIAQCSAYLSDFIRGSTDSNEIRLMILGKKGEGKTSFARRFKKLNARMPKLEESTTGIDVKDFISKPISNDFHKKNIEIKIWDFAGHEVTHAAHKFFLSDKCVYVVVCHTRNDEEDIDSKITYWLEHIRDYTSGNKDSNSNKPKIFILINEVDSHMPKIGKEVIEQNYKEYDLHFERLNIAKDNQKGGKLAAFKNTILEHISTIDTKIPSSYCLMREHINQKFKNEKFVSIEDIIQIIQRDKGDSSSSNEIILKNLSDLAFCFWFNKV
jgi:GTPase SAR1 family protein